jgi:hypothetical protein
MKIVATNFKPVSKNTRKGFVDLTLLDAGMVLNETAWHEKDGSNGSPPAGRSYADKATGEVKWTNLVEFTSREAKAAFQSAGLVAVHKLTLLKGSAP